MARPAPAVAGVEPHDRAEELAGIGRWIIDGITMDVTDLRRAVEDAEPARDRSRAILCSLYEGYFVAEDDVITEVNDALARMTG